MTKSNGGFSLTEALVVTALILFTTTVAIVQVRGSLRLVDADRSSNLVASQLRYARQVAADQRRNVLVEFLGTNQIRLTRQNGGGSTTVISDVRLPNGFTFAIPAGANDTPDTYGHTSPVYFSAGTSGTFLGDGVFVTGAGIVLNGSVFTKGANNTSARAVTLTGASGRTKTYRYQGPSWVLQ
jgi:type II secretory pathway pseudopilin PulG